MSPTSAAGSAPTALILGGGPIAVPIARSLKREGAPVVALGFHTDPVRWSRYCDEFVDLGAGEGVQERWRSWLAERRLEGAVVLPCSDDALELVARHRQELVSLGYRPIEADDDVVLAMLDKHRTYELARGLGVPAPRTELVRPGDDLAELSERVDFPAALKPRHSHLFARHFGMGTKVLRARDPGELLAHGERLGGLGIEAMLTEVVPGPDDAYHSYYTFIDAEGTALFDLTKHKLRQFPPAFGLASYHQLDRHAEAIELGRRFFEGIGLRGLGNVEFKRHARTGELVLIECNHRFTAGHELVRHAGIDLALLAYNRLSDRPHPPLGGYRAGVRMWHPVEDVRTMLELRRRGEIRARDWARSLAHRQHFPVFSWRDPQPSLRSWVGFVHGLRRRQARSRPATASATSSVPAAPSGSRPGRTS